MHCYFTMILLFYIYYAYAYVFCCLDAFKFQIELTKGGNMEAAHHVFDEIPECDIVS